MRRITDGVERMLRVIDGEPLPAPAARTPPLDLDAIANIAPVHHLGACDRSISRDPGRCRLRRHGVGIGVIAGSWSALSLAAIAG